jgi:cation diffusion facilitator CzcD-associated flavoprotein CzcO
VYAPGNEIWDYLERVATDHDLASRTRFGTAVDAAHWRGDHWDVRLSDGDTLSADVLIAATGVLQQIRTPAIEGLASFAGVCFHSARWDHSVPLDGVRVGLIGNGSTGVQIITALAGRPQPLTLFQRTPQWVLPVPNPQLPASWARRPRLARLMRTLFQKTFEQTIDRAVINPGFRRWLIGWACRQNLGGVRDPELRRKLTPDTVPLCRRLIAASGFYDAMQHEQVRLVTESIERVEPAGVRTADGVLHELDVLVLATGFDPHAFMRPMDMTGVGGRTLDQEWAGGARGYRTLALPDFPNFFMLLGPHSPFGNQSQITVAETQIDYVLRWLRRRREAGWTAAAPTRAATEAFNAEIHDALAVPGTVWVTGCTSWYLGADGLPELWPWAAREHQVLLAEADEAAWTVTA